MSLQRYPQPRGQKKKRVVKYGMGGLIVLLLICIVWFPLLFMSLVKSVAGVVNRPLDVSVTITLGGFQQDNPSVVKIDSIVVHGRIYRSMWQNLFNRFSCCEQPNALQFLEAYGAEDVTVAALPGSSNSLWTISPPSRSYLSHVLHLENFPLTLSWTVQRYAPVVKGNSAVYILHQENTCYVIRRLVNVVFKYVSSVIPDVFPCFLRAPSDSNAKPIDQLYPGMGAALCGPHPQALHRHLSGKKTHFLYRYKGVVCNVLWWWVRHPEMCFA
uniref:Uncharacterized protein n=1 Tax=Periophthalmus magnuspinnatus TaxID=409849 RepID=A0A3B4AMX5_9GOBI